MNEYTDAAVAWAKAYRVAALADGWTSEPLSRHEDEERWSRLTRDGFTMQVVARSPQAATAHQMEQRKPWGKVSIWGPDGLAIAPPPTYSWPAISAGLRTCEACGTADVETQRFSFAGRCCAACLPVMRAKYEKPGWYN